MNATAVGPVTQRGVVTASYSEIDAFRQCPFKHYLAYRERWSRDPAPDSALGIGTAWHEIMATHYNALKGTNSLADASAAVAGWVDSKLILDVPTDVLDLLVWMYSGYVQAYGGDDQWEIVAVEHTTTVPLFGANGAKTRFRLKVKVDLIVRDRKTGLIHLIDHKSGKDLPGERELELEEQFGLYELVLTRAGLRVFSTIHNATRRQRNQGDIYQPGDVGYKSTMRAQALDKRHQRTYMKRTKQELAVIEQEAVSTLSTAYSRTPPTERHVNPDTCRWRCDFLDACWLGRRTGSNARTVQMLAETGYQQNFARH